MKIFITGASGYIGSAVVRELLEAGHNVIGLARSDAAAESLAAIGADVHRGDLNDLEILRSGAAASDGVIHLAFNNLSETTDFAAACRADLAAVKTIGSELENSGKPFVVTAGTLALSFLGHLGTENDIITDLSVPRIASENATIEFAKRGVRSSVIRLAPSVHSKWDKHGFIPGLIKIARKNGMSAYIGDGMNRWPAVHLLDAARLFRLAAEAAPAGSRLHGAGEDGIPFRNIAEAIGSQLNLPVVSIDVKDAVKHFGFLSAMVSRDNPVSSELTRKLLGWKPNGPTLITDIEQGSYMQI